MTDAALQITSPVGLIAAGVFTLSFLAGQLWVWQQLSSSGNFVAANPANAFFYLLTALHGLHLLGGLWVWAKTTAKVARGVEVGAVRLSVELCTVYWHYLLLVWLVLFALLLSTPPRQNSCRLLRILSRGGDKGQKWQGTDRDSWTEQ